MKLERSKNYKRNSIQRRIDKVKYEQEKKIIGLPTVLR